MTLRMIDRGRLMTCTLPLLFVISAPASTQDAVRGELVLRDMRQASCLICHSISGLDEKDQGAIGPSLDGVADRLNADELRQRIVDARALNPDTMMPPYFSSEGLFDVGREWAGQTIYSAQDVEDVLAYLLTLREQISK